MANLPLRSGMENDHEAFVEANNACSVHYWILHIIHVQGQIIALFIFAT